MMIQRAILALLLGALVLLSACKPSPTASGSAPASASSNAIRAGTNLALSDPQATNLLQEEVEIDIDKSSEHLTRGNDLLQRSKLLEAIEQFQLAIKFNPEDEDLYYNLAIAQQRIGDTQAAKTNYGKALDLYPDYVEALNNLGNILVNEGNFSEAVVCFEKALQHDDKNPSTHNNLGTAFARQKKYAHSLAHFEAAVQLRPDYADAQFNLGNAYLLLGRTDDAIDQFNRLLQKDPGFAAARLQLQKAQSMKARAASAK